MPLLKTAPFRRALSLLLSLAAIGMLPLPAAAADGETYVHYANQKRISVGLQPVAWESLADQIAVERTNTVAALDALVHDFDYVKARLDASGVCYRGYGEIIARSGSYDPARTMEQWWASTVHRNVISGDYNAAGGSHANGASGVYSVMIWVKYCTAPAPPPGGETDFQRLAGSNRYATAVAVSQLGFPSGASTVFVATGASFPDALAGSPAAAAAGAPILLTARDGLPGATANELARLRPSRIVILGGEGVVSPTVAAQLAGHAPHVERWWGANRYETAAAISRNTFAPGVWTVFLATGSSFPDALSGGAMAGINRSPILLVSRDAIPQATAAELARLRPGQVVVLGGTGVVSEAVRAAAAGYTTTGSAWRLAGADRYATSVEISRSSYPSGSGVVFVATGRNFPDGLAGGAVAARLPGPILLVSPTSLPSTVAAELQRLGPDMVYVIGGAGAVSDGVVNAIASVLP